MDLRFFKPIFVTLLSFGRQLNAQNIMYISLNNQSCLVRVTMVDSDPSKLNGCSCTVVVVNIAKVYPFIVEVVKLLMIYLID